MSDTDVPATTSAAWSRIWQQCWRSPTVTVARFTLKSHVRSGWIFGDIFFIWFLYALFFYEYGGDASYFYGTVGEGLSVLAVLDTVVIVQRSLRSARVYLPLARLTSRSAYIRGLILATCVWRIPLFLLMLVLAMGYHTSAPQIGITDATVGNMLPGAVGLFLNCCILSILTVVLSVPVATRRVQIIFLVWLAAMLYSDSRFSDIAKYFTVTQLPLLPVTACYNLGLVPIVDGYALVMLVVAVGYIIGLTWLADMLLAKRDLILL